MASDAYFCLANKQELAAMQSAVKADPDLDVVEAMVRTGIGWEVDFAHAFVGFIATDVTSCEDGADFITEPIEAGNATLWRFPKDFVEEVSGLEDDALTDAIAAASDKEFVNPEERMNELIAVCQRAEEEERRMYLVLDSR